MLIIRNYLYNICPEQIKLIWNRVDRSLVNSRLMRGTFWSAVGALLSGGLTLLGMIFVAQILGKADYGKLGLIQSTVGMFGIFAGFGLGITSTKYVARFRVSDPKRASRIIALSRVFALLTGGTMALGLLVFAPWLAEHTLNSPDLTYVLRISAFFLFINAINGVQIGILSGLEEFKVITHVNLYIGLFSFPVLLCGAYIWGLTGAVWGLVINLCITWLLNHLALLKIIQKHNISLKATGFRQELSILWKFSLPAMLAGSMVGPVNWFCNAILVNQPNGFDEMGILNAANQWYTLLLFLPQIISRVILPIFSDHLGQENIDASRRTLLQAIKINTFFAVPLVVVISITSPLLMSFYGRGFTEGWMTLVIVIITAGILAITAPAGQLIAASGKMWIGFIMNTGWAFIYIFGTYLFIDYGSLGLASARLISYMIHAIWAFAFIVYLTRQKRNSASRVKNS